MTNLFTDSFDRADNDIVGGNWVESVGDWDIVSNGVRTMGPTGANEALLLNTTALGTANYKVTANITATSAMWSGQHGLGVVARFTSTSAFYLAWLDGNDQTLKLYRGGFVQIGSFGLSPVPSDPFTLALGCNGSTITVDLNGVNRISVTDTTHSAEGDFGVRGFGAADITGHLINSFQVDDFVAAAPQTVVPNAIGSLAGAYAPTVSGGTGAQLVTVGFISSRALPYGPTAYTGDQPPQLGEPTIDQIQSAIKQRLATINGLNAYATEPEKPNFPCAYPRLVDWTFDETMGEASTTWHFDVWVLVGQEPGFNRAQTWLNPYISPTGANSIKAAIDAEDTLGIAVQARVSGGGAYGRVEIAGLNALGASVRVEVLT